MTSYNLTRKKKREKRGTKMGFLQRADHYHFLRRILHIQGTDSWWSAKQKNRDSTVEIERKGITRSLLSSTDIYTTSFWIDWEGSVGSRWACRTQRLRMLFFDHFSTWNELQSNSNFPVHTHDGWWRKAHHLRWDVNEVETVKSFNTSDNGTCKPDSPNKL